MTIETEIAALTVATTDLITEVVDQKDTLAAQVTASAGSASAAAASAADAAVSASNAAAVVTGGTASLTPAAGLIPLADGTGKIANGWLPNNPAFSGEIAANGGIALGDNDKAIFGAGSDLQIYHDGGHSYIDDSGTGLLRLRSSTIYLEKYTGELMADFNADGHVSLLHDNSEKFRTTSTGIDVTGFVNTDGIVHTGDTDTYLKFIDNRIYSAVGNIRVLDFETSSSKLISADSVFLQTGTTALNRLKVSQNGDISFYEDTGTTPKFFWDASAESLGIGTSSPSTALEVKGDGSSVQVSSADYDVALLGRRGSSGTDLDKGYMRLRDTGTTKVAIDSAGNTYFNGGSVGIGTNSPSGKLHVQSASSGGTASGNADELILEGSGNTGLTILSGATSLGNLFFADSGDAADGYINYDQSGRSMRFGTATSERMRIDSSGNLGIGTSSPAQMLHLSGTVPDIQYTDTTGNEYRLGNNNGAFRLYDVTAAAERMRIDSSGNLLVGKSAVGVATEGFEARPSGLLAVNRDGANPAYFGRLTNDGDIIEFRKDGTAVGSIGTAGGDLLVGTGDTAFRFHDGDNRVYPVNASTGIKVDGAVDLGDPTGRFKDLYLSGGVYLGGTGAANKLDDYESGTFTPTVSSGVTSPVYTAQSGSYTKIGNLVYFQFRLDLSSGTADSSAFKFGGLPFTSQNVINYGGAWISYSAGFLDDLGTASWHIGPNNTEVFAYEPTGSTMTGIELDAIGDVLGNVYVNGVYRV